MSQMAMWRKHLSWLLIIKKDDENTLALDCARIHSKNIFASLTHNQQSAHFLHPTSRLVHKKSSFALSQSPLSIAVVANSFIKMTAQCASPMSVRFTVLPRSWRCKGRVPGKWHKLTLSTGNAGSACIMRASGRRRRPLATPSPRRCMRKAALISPSPTAVDCIISEQCLEHGKPIINIARHYLRTSARRLWQRPRGIIIIINHKPNIIF